jgi:hypothetical protein
MIAAVPAVDGQNTLTLQRLAVARAALRPLFPRQGADALMWNAVNVLEDWENNTR